MGVVLATIIFVWAHSTVSAQIPLFAETVVTGVIYGPDGNPLTTGDVTVICNATSLSMPINPDGTYEIHFDQLHCKAGDTATSQATTPIGTGTNSGLVENTVIDGPIVDIDVAIVDVNFTVPEFGVLTGAISVIGIVSSFVYKRTKKFV